MLNQLLEALGLKTKNAQVDIYEPDPKKTPKQVGGNRKIQRFVRIDAALKNLYKGEQTKEVVVKRKLLEKERQQLLEELQLYALVYEAVTKKD